MEVDSGENKALHDDLRHVFDQDGIASTLELFYKGFMGYQILWQQTSLLLVKTDLVYFPFLDDIRLVLERYPHLVE